MVSLELDLAEGVPPANVLEVDEDQSLTPLANKLIAAKRVNGKDNDSNDKELT